MHRKHDHFHSKEDSSIQYLLLYALANLEDFMCQAVEYCAYDNKNWFCHKYCSLYGSYRQLLQK